MILELYAMSQIKPAFPIGQKKEQNSERLSFSSIYFLFYLFIYVNVNSFI